MWASRRRRAMGHLRRRQLRRVSRSRRMGLLRAESLRGCNWNSSWSGRKQRKPGCCVSTRRWTLPRRCANCLDGVSMAAKLHQRPRHRTLIHVVFDLVVAGLPNACTAVQQRLRAGRVTKEGPDGAADSVQQRGRQREGHD